MSGKKLSLTQFDLTISVSGTQMDTRTTINVELFLFGSTDDTLMLTVLVSKSILRDVIVRFFYFEFAASDLPIY
jgi:hypothetical protein